MPSVARGERSILAPPRGGSEVHEMFARNIHRKRKEGPSISVVIANLLTQQTIKWTFICYFLH